MSAKQELLGQLADFRVRFHAGFIHGTGSLSSTVADQQMRKLSSVVGQPAVRDHARAAALCYHARRPDRPLQAT